MTYHVFGGTLNQSSTSSLIIFWLGSAHVEDTNQCQSSLSILLHFLVGHDNSLSFL